AYKEYYAIATGEAAPKPKASVRRTRSSSDTSITPPTTTASPRLKASAKGKQTTKASKAKSLSALSDVAITEAQQLKLGFLMYQLMSQRKNSPGIPRMTKVMKMKNRMMTMMKRMRVMLVKNEMVMIMKTMMVKKVIMMMLIKKLLEMMIRMMMKKDQGLNISEEERHDEEEEEDELYRDININQGRGLLTSLEVEDSHVTLTPFKPDSQQESSLVSSQFVTSMLNPTLDVGMESIFETTSQLDVPTPTFVAPLPITTPTMTSSTIATTTTSQAPILPTTVLSDIIQHLPSFGSLLCFDDRLRSLEENFSKVMQTNQFAGAVSAILEIVQHYMDQRMNEVVKVAVQIQSDRLREEAQRENDEFLRTAVNEQLEAEVLTRSSHSSRTSYAVAADLSEMEIKKILIEKIKGNKETVTLKRRRDDDADKDEEPSAGPDRGSKRRKEGKEPESTSALTKTATRSAGRSTQGSRSRQASARESAFAEEPMQTTSQMEEPSHPEFDTGADDQPIIQSSLHPECELAKQSDTCSSFNELMDTPLDFSNFIMNQLRVNTLNPELLSGPTYDLMKGSCKSLIELEYHLKEVYKATTAIGLGQSRSRKYTTSVTKTKATDYGHIKWIEDLVPKTMWIQEPIDYDKHALWGVSHWGRKRQQFYGFAINRESARDVYSKRRIIAVTELNIVEWHSYKHLDWITRRVEDLQLGVKSYQKRLNLTKPDTYWSDLKRKEAYTAYSNPRGFIYQNKDKKNRLMSIDELHKFSDGTLTDFRTALDDRLKGIWMRYLPQKIWRKSDKDRAEAMIQAIDKRLKTRMIMRSLERFVGGREDLQPDVEAQVWQSQRGIYGLAKVKCWRLLESCRVHVIILTTTQMIFLVERGHPLTRFTLDQMLNNVRLEVEEESEVFLELLRFVRQQQQEGFRPE
nr:hypothetical protein [Tanacetum cinerariifolium]